MRSLRHAIEFQSVAFAYDDRPGKFILRDVSILDAVAIPDGSHCNAREVRPIQ